MKISWMAFALMLIVAGTVINQTVGEMPALVAVHFDAAGQATSFILRGKYRVYVLLFAIGLPILLVALMAASYSRATNLKVPNSEYWAAPQRISDARSFLITHGVWLGSILTGLMTFIHWLVLDANRHRPPVLSNQTVSLGLFVLLGCMVLWIGTLMARFRTPKS
jgi:uncharacterized membrane protein